jgi:hypothetical protein
VQGNRFDRLYHEAQHTLLQYEKNGIRQSSADSLTRTLPSVRGLIERNEYRQALVALADILHGLVRIRLQQDIEDEEALLYYTVYRDARLGLGYWAVWEMVALTEENPSDELLRIDILLILYFLANCSKNG